MSILDKLYDWHSMETAPSDGTPTLVRLGDKIFAVATYSSIGRQSRFTAWASLDPAALVSPADGVRAARVKHG